MKIDHRKDREDWNLLDSPATAGAVLILLMIISMFLVGCSTPIEGKVIDKDWDAGHNEQYQTTERKGCGTETYTETKTVSGSTKTITKTRQKWCDTRVTKTRWVPADWDITIRADDGEEREVDVSEQVYNRIQLGERVKSDSLR